MIRMYASNSHSYTHLILALGIVREPTVWDFITSKYPGTHDIGLPTHSDTLSIPVLDIVREPTVWRFITSAPSLTGPCSPRGSGGSNEDEHTPGAEAGIGALAGKQCNQHATVPGTGTGTQGQHPTCSST